MKKFLLFIYIISINYFSLASEEIKNICIIQTISHPALEMTKKGILDQLAADGFVEGKNAKIFFANAQGDLTLSNQIAKKFASSNPDVIIAIATNAAQSVMAATKKNNIPVVFSSVTDPIYAGLIKNLSSPQANITGVSNFIELNEQISLFKKIIPNLSKIGFIYNTGESNSFRILQSLKEQAKLNNIEVIPAVASKTTEVSDAVNKLVSQKVDAIFISNDNVALAAFGIITRVASTNKIPVFVSDTDMVEKGALASLGPNQYSIGQQTGKIVVEILRGKKIKEISVEFPDKAELFLNYKIARELGIVFSEELLNKARNYESDAIFK